MRLLDLSSDPQLSGLAELLSSLSHASDPRDVLASLVGHANGSSNGRGYAEVSTQGQAPNHYVIRRLRSDYGADLTDAVRLNGITVARGGIIGSLIQTPVPKIARDFDLAADPVLPADMRGYRSAMAIPIFVGQAVHDWIILFDRDPRAFDTDELAQTMLRTSLAGTMLSNLHIARQLFDANIRVQREIADIAAIQRALLPESLPQLPGIELAASYQTAHGAGGDIYDILPVGQGARQCWAIFIGDVSGHGPAAAVVMAMLNCLLHAAVERNGDAAGFAKLAASPFYVGPAQPMAYLNDQLCRRRVGGSFVTALLGIYDPDRRELAYCSAGHTPPILFNPNGSTELLEGAACPPLGLIPATPFTEARIRLCPGQLLLLYTDGITEARNERREQFDTAGIISAVRRGDLAPAGALERIKHALIDHTGKPDPEDDQTMVALRCGQFA